MKKRKELTLAEVVAALANDVPVYTVCRLDPDVRKWPAGAEGFFTVEEIDEAPEPETPVADLAEQEAKKKSKGGRPKKEKPIDDGKIRALFEAGWNLSSIALEVSASSETVRAHLRKMGLMEAKPDAGD